MNKDICRRTDRAVAGARKPSRTFALSLLLVSCLAASAHAQIIDAYRGTDSAGFEVDISVVESTPVNQITYFGFGGNEYCDGALIQGALFGGNTDGTELYPVIDGRATFSELRPDFYIQADIRFEGKGKVNGTALFKQAVYTGPNFPPTNRDVSACSTKQLTFTAQYVGSTVLDKQHTTGR